MIDFTGADFSQEADDGRRALGMEGVGRQSKSSLDALPKVRNLFMTHVTYGDERHGLSKFTRINRRASRLVPGAR